MQLESSDGSQPDWIVKSGVAARLAGIPVETLRVWERRHQITGGPIRQGAQRVYSRAQVERLTLVKRMVDHGHAIGSVATLSDAALRQMMADEASMQREQPAKRIATRDKIQVGMVGFGPGTKHLIKGLQAAAVDMAFATSRLEEVSEKNPPGVDVLLVEMGSLTAAQSGRLIGLHEATGASFTLLLYRYAPSSLIRGLMQKGIEVTRCPTDPDGVETVCAGVLKRLMRSSHFSAIETSAGKHLSEDDLTRLTQVTSEIYCECPRQLAHLLLSVAAFERYSAECSSRYSLDALLHLQLQTVAVEARGMLDQALRRLLAAEGIKL